MAMASENVGVVALFRSASCRKKCQNAIFQQHVKFGRVSCAETRYLRDPEKITVFPRKSARLPRAKKRKSGKRFSVWLQSNTVVPGCGQGKLA